MECAMIALDIYQLHQSQYKLSYNIDELVGNN